MPRTEKEIIKEIIERLNTIEERLRKMIEETGEVQSLIIDREYIDRKNKERRERW